MNQTSGLLGPSASAAGAVHPAVPAQDTAAHVDRTAWGAISALQAPGQPDVLAKVLSLYLEESRTLIERITDAVAKQDAEALARLAHSFKSQNATVGARRLAALCKEIEACGRRKDFGPAVELVRQLSAESPVVCAVFSAEVTQRGVQP